MRFLTLTLVLLAAGCATAPKPVVAPRAAPEPARERGDLIGLDAGALGARFGQPRLQVREGVGTKLQYAGGSCLLDAYLYPPVGGGAARVVHVDTRNREGQPVGQPGCIAMIEAR